MDDLIGILIGVVAFLAFVVYIVLPIIGGILAIGAALLVLAALAGSLSGMAVGVRNFWKLIKAAHDESNKTIASDVVRHPPALIKRFADPQPARLMYIYERAWLVKDYLLNHVKSVTERDARQWFKWASEQSSKVSARPWESFNIVLNIWQGGASIGLVLGGFFHYVMAYLIVGLFMLLLFIFSLLVMVFSTLLIGILAAINSLLSYYYQTYFRCTECHMQMEIPVYTCPNPKCGKEHTRLRPSIYGIFHHRCNNKLTDGSICGEKIPTGDWWGRKEIEQRCAVCEEKLIPAIGRGRNVHLPIVGAPSVGKTNFIVSALDELQSDFANRHNLAVTLPAKRDQDEFEEKIGQLTSGRRLAKTAVDGENPFASTVRIEPPRQRIPELLYIYDAAGEYFNEQEATDKQVYFQHADGIFFILDPFSIPMVHEQYKDRIEREGHLLAVSKEDPDEIYGRMKRLCEIHYGKSGDKFPYPIAVVLTKADAFDLEEHIGEPAVKRLREANPSIQYDDDAINILVEQFLIANGATNLLNSLQNDFSTFKFFTCSVLDDNTTNYAPRRVLQPVSWLLSQVNVLQKERAREQEIDRHDREEAQHRGNILQGLQYYFWDSLKPRQTYTVPPPGQDMLATSESGDGS